MMTPSNEKTQREQQGILWPLVTLMLIAVLGIVIAHIANSSALRVDAMVCMVDVGVGLITLWVSYVSRKGPDPRYPIGRMGWVPLLNTAKGTLLLAICLNGVAEAARAVIDGAEPVDFRLPALYSVIVLGLEFSNFLYVRRIARQIGSQIEQLLDWREAATMAAVLLAVTLVIYAVYDFFFGLDRLWRS